MPTNLYGSDDNFDLETSHVLPALIRKFHEAKIRGAKLPEDRGEEKSVGGGTIKVRGKSVFASSERLSASAPQTSNASVTIWGTGTPRREFLHVDDLADACVFLMKNYDESEIINIGVGKDITIRELAELIRDIVGFQGSIQYDSSKPDGTPRKLLDVSRLRSLGWQPKISLREGMEKLREK
jgi:GDP-L-fucose synthase